MRMSMETQTNEFTEMSYARYQRTWRGFVSIINSGVSLTLSAYCKSINVNYDEHINRYISLSRKNSLFFGSHAGAERSAIFYSLACSCRLHRINFFEYLSDVLNRCAEMPNGAPPDAFRELLPDRWMKKEQGA